jgi:hypothetical protein
MGDLGTDGRMVYETSFKEKMYEDVYSIHLSQDIF